MSPARALLMLAVAGLLVSARASAGWEMPDLSKMVDTVKDVKSAVGTPDDEEERALGQDVAATLLGAAKPLANPAVQQYVNRVGMWVAQQTKRPNLGWRFAVLDNANVNAFAAPGGYVFITRGLLEQLHSEAELAGVLGHEIAHVEKKHHLKALKKDSGIKLLGRGASQVLDKSGGAKDMERLGQVASVAKGLYSRGLDKEDEFDADRAGTIYAARAGYDPYGLVQVLQTLDSMNASSSQLALLFKTHPKPSDRLAKLDEVLGARMDALGARPSVTERFVATMKKK